MPIIVFSLSIVLLFLGGCQQAPVYSPWSSVTQVNSNLSTLQVGDVIIKQEGVGFEEWFGHAALYVGDGVVLEAPNPEVGVIYNYLSNWPTNRHIIILRYQHITPQITLRLLEFSNQVINKPYLISFQKENQSGYSCSSLIYDAFLYATGKPLTLEKQNVWIVMPYDFLSSKEFSSISPSTFPQK